MNNLGNKLLIFFSRVIQVQREIIFYCINMDIYILSFMFMIFFQVLKNVKNGVLFDLIVFFKNILLYFFMKCSFDLDGVVEDDEVKLLQVFILFDDLILLKDKLIFYLLYI